MAKGSKKRKGTLKHGSFRVQNIVDNVKTVHNSNSPDKLTNNTLVFDFTYKNWLKSIGTKDFVNKLPSNEDFAKFTFDILYKIFPEVQNNWTSIKREPGKRFRHCHPIDRQKLELVRTISQNIHGRILLDVVESDTYTFWQLGTTQSVRVVGIYDASRNVMYPMFIDYHHLIHPDKHHNQPDFKSFKFCPYCYYEKSLSFR